MIKVTPLLRFYNISPQSFSRYFELLEKELITEELDGKDGKYVKLTNRGIHYLREYKAVLRFIGVRALSRGTTFMPRFSCFFESLCS